VLRSQDTWIEVETAVKIPTSACQDPWSLELRPLSRIQTALLNTAAKADLPRSRIPARRGRAIFIARLGWSCRGSASWIRSLNMRYSGRQSLWWILESLTLWIGGRSGNRCTIWRSAARWEVLVRARSK